MIQLLDQKKKILGQEEIECNGPIIAEFSAQYVFHSILSINSPGYVLLGIQPIKEKLTDSYRVLQHGDVPV